MFAIEKMFVIYNTDDGATTIEPFKKCRCNVIDGKERIEINDTIIDTRLNKDTVLKTITECIKQNASILEL